MIKKKEGEEEDSYDVLENDSGGDFEIKDVQMGNYDDVDEDYSNDDNYVDVNLWVELID